MNFPGIRNPLRLLFGMLLLGYLVAFVLFAVYTWFETVRVAGERLGFRSSLLAGTTQEVLYHYEGILQILGRQALEHGVLDDPESVRPLLEKLLADNPALAGYGLARPDGQLILVSNIPPGSPLPNLLEQPESRDTFLLALKSPHMILGRSYWFPLLQKWIIPLRLPMRDADGRVVLLSLSGFDLTSPDLSWNRLQLLPGERFHLIREDGFPQMIRPLRLRGTDDPLFQTPLSARILDLMYQTERTGRADFDTEADALCLARPIERYGLHAMLCTARGALVEEWLRQMMVPFMVFVAMLAFGILFYRFTRRLEREVESERAEHEAQLAWLAQHDTLTGLPNRLLLEDRLDQAIRRARRESHQLALILADLDNFKRINDGLGHQVGDRLLIEVARRLRDTIRDSDTVVRFGGDEFVILLERIDRREDAIGLADKIISSFRTPFRIGDHQLMTSMSLGIAIFPGDGDNPESLTQSADTALYEAKNQGRNRFVFYARELNTRTRRYLEIEAELRNALERDEFRLFYQPQVDLATLRPVGLEALLRWHSPRLGEVSPAEFIPIAEDSGLIRDIGRWVYLTAMREMDRIEQACGCHLDLALNISALELRGPDFVELLRGLFDRTQRSPSRVEIEITEGVLVGQHTRAPELLRELADMGLRIAIDDFGTGYSSLAYLSHLPIHTLKVDQSFVRTLPDDTNNAVLTRTIIAMGASMGLKVVAEGVENADILEFLRENACDVAQGYLFSPPLAFDELIDWLHTHHPDERRAPP